MVFVCAGLVTTDEGNGIVRLVHYTAHEYFERTRLPLSLAAENSITVACETHLSLTMIFFLLSRVLGRINQDLLSTVAQHCIGESTQNLLPPLCAKL
jgi:hypothetical protein